jgi:hypothetical protein
LPSEKASVDLDRLRSQLWIVDGDARRVAPGPLAGSEVDHIRCGGDLTDDQSAGASEAQDLRAGEQDFKSDRPDPDDHQQDEQP